MEEDGATSTDEYDSDDVTSGGGGTVHPTGYQDNEGEGGLRYPTWAACIILIACAIIMLGTILGNLLVCTAVSIVRKLRTPSNWLIVSLAVADLLVALLVMPLASAYEVRILNINKYKCGGVI